MCQQASNQIFTRNLRNFLCEHALKSHLETDIATCRDTVRRRFLAAPDLGTTDESKSGAFGPVARGRRAFELFRQARDESRRTRSTRRRPSATSSLRHTASEVGGRGCGFGRLARRASRSLSTWPAPTCSHIERGMTRSSEVALPIDGAVSAGLLSAHLPTAVNRNRKVRRFQEPKSAPLRRLKARPVEGCGGFSRSEP